MCLICSEGETLGSAKYCSSAIQMARWIILLWRVVGKGAIGINGGYVSFPFFAVRGRRCYSFMKRNQRGLDLQATLRGDC